MNKYVLFALFSLLTFQFTANGQGWKQTFYGSQLTDLDRTPNNDFLNTSNAFFMQMINADGTVRWEERNEPTGQIEGQGSAKSAFNEQNDFLMVTALIWAVPGTDVRNINLHLRQYNSDGTIKWSNWEDPTGNYTSFHVPVDIQPTSDNGWLVLMGQYQDTIKDSQSNIHNPLLFKVSGEGVMEWVKTFPDITDKFLGLKMHLAKHPGNEYSIVYEVQNDYSILRLNEMGDELSRTPVNYTKSSYDNLRIISRPDGYTIFKNARRSRVNTSNEVESYHSLRWFDVDFQGNVSNDYNKDLAPGEYPRDMAINEESAIFQLLDIGRRKGMVRKTDPTGNLIWESAFESVVIFNPQNIVSTTDGGAAFSGNSLVYDPNSGRFRVKNFLCRLDSLGNTYTSEIKGNVFDDLDEDCAPMVEDGLERWFVKADGPIVQYTRTDSLGNYRFMVPDGSYEMSTISTSPYWLGCEETYPLTIGVYDTVEQNLPVQAAIDCPYMEVDLGVPFLRRCFNSTYTVNYCNGGTVVGENAYVEITLDPYLEYLSSNIPATQNGQMLTFDLGDVEPGACGRFQFTVYVDCDSTMLGQNHCVEARIYPDTTCYFDAAWSGASIEVNARCTGDSIRFDINNVGTAPTTVPVEYIIVEDQVILREGNSDVIQPGGSMTISIPANGGTYNLTAQQEPHHPSRNIPSATIEGCGGTGQNVRLGFYNQFWENDGDPFVSIDCRPNIGSYDPNDKQGFPTGIGEEHLITANTPIEYMIRFQNTGTDTAFNVRIFDPISENLDLSSIKVGASSHPYRFEILDGRSLIFHFDNILLVDSNANEAASHGFIKFKINQAKDLPDGSLIKNSASIFFDFNLPIITNETEHQVGEFFTTSTNNPTFQPATKITAWPNPTNDELTIALEGVEATKKLELSLYDVNGRLLSQQTFSGQRLQLSLAHLPEAIYFYEVKSESVVLGRGKVMRMKKE